MNLSEALDAALPEIPRGRLTRVRPPCIDPALIVREDTLDGEAIVGAFQRSNGNYFRFSPLQWQLASLFDGVRTYDETASLFNEQTGAQLTPDEARLFAQNMDEADFWYQSPQEKNIALHEKLTAQRHRRAKRKSKINMAHISFSAWDPDRYLTWLDARVVTFVYSRWTVLAAVLLFFFESLIFVAQWHVIGPDIPLYYNSTRRHTDSPASTMAARCTAWASCSFTSPPRFSLTSPRRGSPQPSCSGSRPSLQGYGSR